jgi:hypothetical protein
MAATHFGDNVGEYIPELHLCQRVAELGFTHFKIKIHAVFWCVPVKARVCIFQAFAKYGVIGLKLFCSIFAAGLYLLTAQLQNKSVAHKNTKQFLIS